MPDPDPYITVGRVQGVFGVHGWIKVFSYTRPPDNIFSYTDWQVGPAGAARPVTVAAHRRHGNKLLAKLESVDDRDLAAGLVNLDIRVPRALLPALPPGEFYWADLIGLEAVSPSGIRLGVVTRMLETGANDVLVVSAGADEDELLVPYVSGVYIKDVDIPAGRVTIDWPE